MENERFNMSLRKFLKHVGVTSQQEIERIVREQHLEGKGKLNVKMVLTADGTNLRHDVMVAAECAAVRSGCGPARVPPIPPCATTG